MIKDEGEANGLMNTTSVVLNPNNEINQQRTLDIRFEHKINQKNVTTPIFIEEPKAWLGYNAWGIYSRLLTCQQIYKFAGILTTPSQDYNFQTITK